MIAVGSLAFKRFLEIARLLDLNVTVVTDNDGDLKRIEAKYGDYLESSPGKIRICYDPDEKCKTLEPQLLKVNSLSALNDIFGTAYETTDELENFMRNNKTDCALKLFTSSRVISYPGYINDAVQ